MSEIAEAVNYRCLNCQQPTSESPPERCPVCKGTQFEEYAPARIGRDEIAAAVALGAAYLLTTRLMGNVYDPVWMITAGIREGYPSATLLGLLVGVLLVPAMLSWLVFRTRVSIAIAAASLVIWIVLSVHLRELVFA